MITSTDLYKMANNNGFKETVYSVFGNDVRISIPISEKYFSNKSPIIGTFRVGNIESE